MKHIISLFFFLVLTINLTAQENRMYRQGFYSDVSISGGYSLGVMQTGEIDVKDGTVKATQRSDLFPFSLLVNGGWCFGNGFYAGLGTGYVFAMDFDFKLADGLWPIYADFRYMFSDKKVSPFLGVSAGCAWMGGINLQRHPGPYCAVSAGVTLSQHWSLLGRVAYSRGYYVPPATFERVDRTYLSIGASYAF